MKSKEIQKKEENLQKEFLSKINKGAYLYQYSGLWALGLDLLPIRAGRLINLFVYRGCTCALQARFTTPLTIEKPFKQDILNLTQEKHCKKRFTNQTFNLGKIKQRFIIFALMPDKNAKYIKLKFKIDNLLINIYITNYSINFDVKNFKGSWIKHTLPSNYKIGEKVFFSYGDNIYFNIILQPYYFWISTENDKHFLSVNSFWPSNWFNEKIFNENTKGTVHISGDLVPISMISVGHLVGRNRLHRPSNQLYVKNFFKLKYLKTIF
ncbi:unnamed protein product [Meloidogyne enterolobii]|uniref:Uncharacterized protein n=1 Tax=Meloidogyne enterolobii TaxID=390850 RepID=A0ACB0ZUB3_MELEN